MLDYTSYLQLPRLLKLQIPVSPYQKEELIFITTHQAMELWLKVLIVEVINLHQLFSSNQTRLITLISSIDKCCLYWEAMVAQFNAIQTLSPIDFSKFRQALQGASVAQSEQYKQLEKYVGLFGEQTSELNLKITVLNFLYQEALKINCLTSENHDYWLILLYKNSADHETLINKLIEFDEWFERWKSEHLRLAKRMIGSKIGTGGASAAELANKVDVSIFPELSEIKRYL